MSDIRRVADERYWHSGRVAYLAFLFAMGAKDEPSFESLPRPQQRAWCEVAMVMREWKPGSMP